MKKVCQIINDKYTWLLRVDGEEIPFQTVGAATYFAAHYESLGYLIEWDHDKWKWN